MHERQSPDGGTLWLQSGWGDYLNPMKIMHRKLPNLAGAPMHVAPLLVFQSGCVVAV